jgi:PAS domain S-box-containing protein
MQLWSSDMEDRLGPGDGDLVEGVSRLVGELPLRAGVEDDPILSAVIDALPFYVTVVDEDHRIVLANRAVLSHFRLDAASVREAYCPQLVHGCDGPYPGCPLEQAVRTGEPSVATEFFDRESSLWLESAVYELPFRNARGRRLYFHMVRDISARKRAEQEAERLQRELSDALAKVLSGFIPICMHCKRIRTADEHWLPVESYVTNRTEAVFSHGICPSCLAEHYPKVGKPAPGAPPGK